MRTIVLNFHGIGSPDRVLEEGEARYWVSEDFFRDCVAMADDMIDSVNTVFSFDDGNLSDLLIAAPVLQASNRTGRFFVLSSRMGQPGSLSADALKALLDEGHTIGSHGADHVDWRGIDDAEREREFEFARQIISDATGTEINEVAIPFGRYNGPVLTELKSRGYQKIFSSDRGDWVSDRAPIPRTSPRGDMTLDDVRGILKGHRSIKEKARTLAARAYKRVF